MGQSRKTAAPSPTDGVWCAMNRFTPPQLEFIDICRLAYQRGASDIHFEPQSGGIAIRFRIDGVLVPVTEIPKSRMNSVSENVKSLLGFEMALFGVPQDSRFCHPSEPVDFRANLLPMLYGEKICLRLLDRKQDFHLDHYPLYENAKSRLKAILGKGQGLIIVSGPTGSGKSTLLYSALGSLDRHGKAIYTVEDPVEYILDGLIQIPIKPPKIGFGDALRALLRQDPDVIMVGELRDKETAEVAIHAANTGHLVLTTVHANSAEDVCDRLQTLGVNRELLETALLFASAQRLPSKLCPDCSVDDPEGFEVIKTITEDRDFTPKKAMGCQSCGGTGISGRVLLFEFISSEATKDGRSFRRHDDLKNQAIYHLREGRISASEAYKCFSD